MQTAAEPRIQAYEPPPGAFDEAFLGDGTPREHYAALLEALAGCDLDDLTRTVAADLHSRGAEFGRAGGGVTPFVVDPIPRLLLPDEWDLLEAGLCQRVRALNAFIGDAYGERRIFDAGRMPERVLVGEHYESAMRDVPVPHGAWAGAAGLDIVRGADGTLQVLEDNLRTPSGWNYLLAARDVLDERLPHWEGPEPHSVGDIVERLGAALRACAPEDVEEPSVVVLSDGEANSAWWEHRLIGHQLNIPVVALGDLEPRGDRLYARVDDKLWPVDVVYRRTDRDRLTGPDGKPTPFSELLLPAMCKGRLAVFNAFGTGIADDKLAHAYVEEMIRFYLAEEPVLPSVETFDLGEPDQLADALDRLDDLVVKERSGEGGYGVTIWSQSAPERRESVLRELRRRPHEFVAQERILLSTHPTVIDGGLAPRHVDLRPFTLTAGRDVSVIPGGLTRVAFGAGALVVNSSQNGGGKDTWVLT